MNSLPRWDIYINMWAINGGDNKYILVGSADVTHTINVEKSRLLTNRITWQICTNKIFRSYIRDQNGHGHILRIFHWQLCTWINSGSVLLHMHSLSGHARYVNLHPRSSYVVVVVLRAHFSSRHPSHPRSFF